MIGFEHPTWLILAQAAKDAAKGAADGAPASRSVLEDLGMMPAILAVMALFYFLMIRPQRAAERAKEQTLRDAIDNLKDTDRVVTIGGIHGVVTNIQRDAGIVTIRVDDSTGAKLRVGTSAIARVVTEDQKAE